MGSGKSRLYLELPEPAHWPTVGALAHILDRVNVSCLLFPRDAGDLASALIETAQRRDVAALIRDDAKLALQLEADGVHLPADLENYQYARDLLGLGSIIGSDGGKLRDDAMIIADAGAEYIAFSDPDRDALIDRVAWWSELFTVPCVAFGVTTAGDALALATAGADFIAPATALWAGGGMVEELGKFAASLASLPEPEEGSPSE